MSVAARWRAARQRRAMRRWAGPRLLAAVARHLPDPFFVEIGANDGTRHDHLRPFVTRHGWRGLMVEPVPYVFARLEANHAGLPGVRCVNAAVDRTPGRRPFWHLEETPDPAAAGVPGWYDALGSFSRETVLRHAAHVPGLEGRLTCTEVECLTFDELLDRHGVARVDVVTMDTEGHDWAVLQGIDLERHRPVVVEWEHFHLAPADRTAARAHLEAHGYATLEEGFDTWALRVDAHPGLGAAWSRLRPGTPGISVHDRPAREGAGG